MTGCRIGITPSRHGSQDRHGIGGRQNKPSLMTTLDCRPFWPTEALHWLSELPPTGHPPTMSGPSSAHGELLADNRVVPSFPVPGMKRKWLPSGTGDTDD